MPPDQDPTPAVPVQQPTVDVVPKTAPVTPTNNETEAIKARLAAAEAEAAEGKAAKERLAVLESERQAAEQKALEEQGKWKELAEKRAADAAALQRRILAERVRSTALSEGLIDEALVGMIPTDESFLANGEPVQARIAKAVADFKASKAHFFRVPASPSTGAGAAPAPVEPVGQKFDFSKVGTENANGKAANRSALAEVDALFSRAKRELRR